MTPLDAIHVLETGERFAHVREAYEVASRERWRRMPEATLFVASATFTFTVGVAFGRDGEALPAVLAGLALSLILVLGRQRLGSLLRLTRSVSRWQEIAHAWAAEERQSKRP